jgi:hypothetical protein
MSFAKIAKRLTKKSAGFVCSVAFTTLLLGTCTHHSTMIFLWRQMPALMALGQFSPRLRRLGVFIQWHLPERNYAVT